MNKYGFSKVSLQEIQDWLKKGNEINSFRFGECTQLFVASGSNNLEAVRFLLENGADMEVRDRDNQATPLITDYNRFVKHWNNCNEVNLGLM